MDIYIFLDPELEGFSFWLIILRHVYFFQRLGAVFPPKSDRPASVVKTPQAQGRSSYGNNLENGNEAAESSAEAEFPSLRYIMKSHFIFLYGSS